MKSSRTEKGFSLIEVVVALLILSISIFTIYEIILSNNISSNDLEKRYLSKQVANNRIALMNTIEKPLKPTVREGKTSMGGINWIWLETIKKTESNEFYEFEIKVKIEEGENYTYIIKGLLAYE